MNIELLIEKKILDNSTKSIQYYLSKLENKYVLHIYNPQLENIKITDDNISFFTKLINMLFNKKNKDGCFNHELFDDHPFYNYSIQELTNSWLHNRYVIIMINKNLIPLCYFSIENNTINSVCTNLVFRNKGYMTLLLDYILYCIKNNLLIIKIDINKLNLNILKTNPIKNKLIKYYNNFNFIQNSENDKYIIMTYNNLL